ncbi:MAG: hypothetical protein OEQ13_06965 [Acidobacteriota bacterium]|nr:hypothetical protein [Acidobacteriota bacterium]
MHGPSRSGEALRVVFAASSDPGVADEVRRGTGVMVEEHSFLSGRQLAEVAGRADVLVTRSSHRVDEDLLRAGRPRLRAVVQASAGSDNIDVEAAARLGVELVIVDPGNATSVAELTMLSLLAMARSIDARWRTTSAGRWPDRECIEDRELAGKTLGLVGIGRVGSRVAMRASSFELEVLACDPYVETRRFEELGVERVGDLDDMLPRLDALSLHCPLTRETDGMIDEDRLGRLPRGALLVNTARGRIVDEAALARALDTGRLGGAALDVFREEPASPGGLSAHPKVHATPHVAGHTVESHARRRENLVTALTSLVARVSSGHRGEG